ncbi:MAG: TonB family protein [Acidobacteriota bacterium]
MDVSDVLRDRMQQPAGLQLGVTVAVLAHATLIVGVLFAPRGFLAHRPETTRTSMTISLGGSGAAGPQNGGLTSIGGRPVQVQTPPEDKPKPEAARPPAAKAPEMTVPLAPARPTKSKTALQPIKQAPDEARGRTPTHGAEVVNGSAVAETGARGQGFGLSTGGAPGAGATLDVGDFCCPEYVNQMVERIRSTWDQYADSAAVVVVRFTIDRDGTILEPIVEKSSANQTLDFAARRAVVIAKQLAPLPPQFPNRTLTVHLTFQYQR